MAVLLKEACGKCGKAMTNAEIGDYWYHSEREPSFRCLCTFCARAYRLHEPDGSLRPKQQAEATPQLTLL